MADAVTVQTLYDGPGEYIVKLTNVSDGTGESAVTKITVASLSAPCSELAIKKITFSTAGMGVDLLWGATANVLIWHIPPDFAEELCFDGSSQLVNNAGAGKTGNLLLTTEIGRAHV